jgi:hypothetical protein
VAVLVLTAHDDDTAARVCQALAARGHDYVRMDLGDFPASLSFTASGPGPAWVGRLSNSQRDLTLADIEAVYWRRPTSFRLPAHLSEQQRRFAVAEARHGMGGVISCLPVPFVNHPCRVADAELKPAQLQAAAELGLMVPPEASDIDDASIALSPCQFQKFIPKNRDIRLVAVGQECFAVAIHAGSDKSYVDWRADYPSLPYEPVETPSHIVEAVTTYLKRFGLSFGCFDFTESADTGQWVFLECGANAQWGWLEHETGLPIADAIARQLTEDTP